MPGRRSDDEDISRWNVASPNGDHAQAGYFTADSDPKIGGLENGAIPMWNGPACG